MDWQALIDKKTSARRIDHDVFLDDESIINSIEVLENEEMWASRVIDEYSKAMREVKHLKAINKEKS